MTAPMTSREELAAAIYAVEYDAEAYLFANAIGAERELFLKFADAAIERLRAGVAHDAVRAAAERVCWFDWSDNDMDAVAAIDALRKAITSSVPSTVQRRPDETGDEYEARVGLIPSEQGNTP